MEPRNTSGEQFIHSKQPSLHIGPVVEHEQTRLERAGDETHTRPADKIADWMEVLEKTHGHDDLRVLERIKQSYHKSYVIQPENVPESTFLLEQRIARAQGYGDMPLTQEYREAKTCEIVSNQEASLDNWVDYLTSEDALYPTWAKYWAFDAVTKMGKFEKKIETQPDGTDHETARFAKRDSTTTAPFPPLNPRALALTIGVMQARLEQRGLPKADRTPLTNESNKLTDDEFAQLATSESFSRLYTQFLIELPEYSTEGLQETRGAWRVYRQGSDPQPLVNSLEGYPLEWCTANVDTARNQLEGGDFHVYYSLDQDGEPTIPRVAIRMYGDSIAEVRGIAANQNMDPYISDVVAAKMIEFPGGEQYQKRSADMARVTAIEEQLKHDGQELTQADLRFLYEIDGEIKGFGYARDPRIGQLLEGRDVRTDLTAVFGCPPEQISLTATEAIHGSADSPILFHYGTLNLSGLTSAEGLALPQAVGGGLNLRGLTSADGLALPQTVGGGLYLGNITSAEGLTFPQTVGDILDLDSLTSADGLALPQTVCGSLNLGGLTSAEGLTFPQTVGGSLNLRNLTSANGLTLPQTVGSFLYLDSLTSAAGLTLPQTVGSFLYLNSLTSAEGLALPQTVGGGLNLSGLTSADGLALPQTVGGSLILGGLTSVEGLALPQTVGGSLSLGGLSNSEKNELRAQRPDLYIS